ncbi:hypothetical protein MM239_20500 [Belliella sp. DSM 111904]|uniref:Uncharacterized protein n=1 Tax=Belliella filtrata TaxID=2923435 RepID=A0ABS9V5T1_9BACT|nr:hypothetical protein [Belliella filtrata]MCH7411779.1 hypothetical protein [Belliella filtrata]
MSKRKKETEGEKVAEEWDLEEGFGGIPQDITLTQGIGCARSSKKINKGKLEDSKESKNRVGETGLIPVSTSHTTVRTVRYTAVPCFTPSKRTG